MMKFFMRKVELVLSLLLVNLVHAEDPTVTNVRASQQTGTKLVEIYYDLSGSISPVFVSLQISTDGGTNYAEAATSITGDVGPNIESGNNRKIIWNAGVDWNNQYSKTVRFRVSAVAVFSAIPILVTPSNNSTKYYNSPAHPRHTFTWQAVDGADSYRLVVINRLGNVVVDEVLNGLTFTPDMDLYTVTWRVYAAKQGVYGPSSPIWTAKVVVFIGGGEF